MEIVINITEAASNLAHNAARDEMIINEEISMEDEMIVESDPDTLIYSDKAQDYFNRWYDYIYFEIEKCKIKQKNDSQLIKDHPFCIRIQTAFKIYEMSTIQDIVNFTREKGIAGLYRRNVGKISIENLKSTMYDLGYVVYKESEKEAGGSCNYRKKYFKLES